MNSSPLYPAYQKYYSALKCLEKFKVDDSFFDNISSLDTFFSEYRSTTLVLQKAIAHTQYEEAYNNFPIDSWDPFFNKQRIQAIHIHPTEILKTISFDVYLPNRSISISNHTISIEEDASLSALLDSAKNILEQFNLPEVFFSARFLVTEKNSGTNLWEKILEGLSTMHQFMDFMYSQTDQQCPLCEQLRSKIKTLDPRYIPQDFASVFDYVYHPEQKSFERASRIGVVFGLRDESKTRFPISGFGSKLFKNTNFSPFEKFVLMHAAIPIDNFMPVIMIIYSDGFCSLEVFHSGLKTTFYRKINETAAKIKSEDVKEVFFLVTYISITNTNEEFTKMTAAERATLADQEYVVFVRIGDDLEETEYSFTPSQLNEPEYVISVLNDSKMPPLILSRLNMMPIEEAFRMARDK